MLRVEGPARTNHLEKLLDARARLSGHVKSVVVRLHDARRVRANAEHAAGDVRGLDDRSRVAVNWHWVIRSRE